VNQESAGDAGLSAMAPGTWYPVPGPPAPSQVALPPSADGEDSPDASAPARRVGSTAGLVGSPGPAGNRGVSDADDMAS
jgi:hypothetical protein